MTNGLPREEADAKFEALEARLETRLTQLDTKIEQRFLMLDTKIDQRFLTLDTKIETAVLGLNSKIDSKFELMLQEIRHVGEISVEARAAARSIKWNMLFASLGTLGVTMTMLFGLWAVGYQIADLIKPR
jgi:hypothetical protein